MACFPFLSLSTPPLIFHQAAVKVKVTCVLLAKRPLFNTRGSRQRCGRGALDSLKCCLSFQGLCFPRVETPPAGVEDRTLPGQS